MNGRYEKEIKTFELIENNLKELPFFVYEWYVSLKASQKTASSCNDYVNKIRNFIRYINTNTRNVKCEDITLLLTQQYYISIQTRKTRNTIKYMSDSYKQGVWHSLNSFFLFLNKKGYIPENYMEYIDKPKNRDLERINESRVLLTKKNFDEILNSIDSGVGSDKAKKHQQHMKNRDKAIISLFMTTGIRKTALSEINLEDIDFDNKILYVTDKGNKRHIYNLTDKYILLLNEWIFQRDNIINIHNQNALFVTEDGKRLSGSEIYKIVSKYSYDALGYHISPHKLRAGFCSILYNETNNLEFVRRAVGHSNISTTQRYVVTNNEERKRASEIMSCLNI